MPSIPFYRRAARGCLGSLTAILFAMVGCLAAMPGAAAARPAPFQDGPIREALEGGRGWINTSGPIHIEDLRGKIVLLDFWTYCCINCHHILPDLEYLEKKYPNELVVIGVHTAKFEAEKETENIRKKVAEYRIKHPVVNDANQVLWNRFQVSSWPTLVVIDAAGRYVGAAPGEGNRDVVDKVIAKKIAEARHEGILDTDPISFFPESEKPHHSPLLYPGKLVADTETNQLFISDTGNNRIVITNLEGRHVATIGSGAAGLANGGYSEAAFNRPQGLCLYQGKLYVADVENHAVREVDLQSRQVRTVAGTGKQVFRREGSGKASTSPLNSPWDVVPVRDNVLAVAMAGSHQIWELNLAEDTLSAWAGNGREDIGDGSLAASSFAQPSGLATDGKYLYVADSEGSAVRAISLEKPFRVATIAGSHNFPNGMSLFAFGDEDGLGGVARLQHCLGVTVADGTLYVADSYNNKIKRITLAYDDKGKQLTPARCKVESFVGSRSAGQTDDPAQFDEPGGVSAAGDQLFVADTNNHAIRVIDRASRKVRTLELDGVSLPHPTRSRPTFPRAAETTVPQTRVEPGESVKLLVKLELPDDFEINAEAPMPYLLESPDNPDSLEVRSAPADSTEISPPRASFEVEAVFSGPRKAGETMQLRLSVASFECKKEGAGLCRPRNYVWNIPVVFASGGTREISLDTSKAVVPAPPPRERPRPRLR